MANIRHKECTYEGIRGAGRLPGPGLPGGGGAPPPGLPGTVGAGRELGAGGGGRDPVLAAGGGFRGLAGEVAGGWYLAIQQCVTSCGHGHGSQPVLHRAFIQQLTFGLGGYQFLVV